MLFPPYQEDNEGLEDDVLDEKPLLPTTTSIQSSFPVPKHLGHIHSNGSGRSFNPTDPLPPHFLHLTSPSPKFKVSLSKTEIILTICFYTVVLDELKELLLGLELET